MSFFKPATSPAIPAGPQAAGTAASPASPAAAAPEAGNARRLTVGPGISLAGEV